MSLSVVVPIFNESENIKIFLDRLLPILEKIKSEYEVIFVLDPSEDNSEQIISTATNPLEDTFWSKADKPFTFLAWSMEYKAFADSEFDAEFITTLPIQADCSNSGLQHYSAMMRDPIGARATNLIPSNKPQDVYAEVAKVVVDKLEHYKLFPRPDYMRKGKLRRCYDEQYASLWTGYSVNRKTCKKPVMCKSYSLTRYTCRKYKFFRFSRNSA